MITSSRQPSAIGYPAYSQTMACEPVSARAARRLAARALAAWCLEELNDRVSVCVSEMVSNSVQHSATKLLRVTVSQSDIRWIRVSVTEFDRSLPKCGWRTWMRRTGADW